MTTRRAKIQDGFSLIEAAIVLSIVGLVIGGIWVAASAVKDNMHANHLMNDIYSTNRAIWDLYKGQDILVADTGYYLDSFFMNAGIAPKSWIHKPSLHWFETEDGTIIRPVMETNNQPKIYTSLPRSVCNRLLKKFPVMGMFQGKIAIQADAFLSCNADPTNVTIYLIER